MNTDVGSRMSWAGLATEFAESSEKWNAGFIIQKSLRISGPSPVVQWLGLQASTAGGMDSIPGQGTKIPHAAGAAKKKIIKNFKRMTAEHKAKFSTFPRANNCTGHRPTKLGQEDTYQAPRDSRKERESLRQEVNNMSSVSFTDKLQFPINLMCGNKINAAWRYCSFRWERTCWDLLIIYSHWLAKCLNME